MGIAAAETIIAWQSHEGPRIARAGGHDIIQCTMCGFRHVVPLPEPRAFEHTYRDVYAREAFARRVIAVERRPKLVGNRPRRFAGKFRTACWARRGAGCSISGRDRAFSSGRRKPAVGGYWASSRRERHRSMHAGLVSKSRKVFSMPRPHLGLDATMRSNSTMCWSTCPIRLKHCCWRANCSSPAACCASTCPTIFRRSRSRRAWRHGLPEWWVAPNRHLNYFDFDSRERSSRAARFRARRADDQLPDGNVSPDG